jgi:hypothetical protein
MNEPDLVVFFPSQDAAKAFAKAQHVRVSRALAATPHWSVRLRPQSFPERLRMRLAAMDAGAVSEPLAKHQEWRCHPSVSAGCLP